MCDSLFAGSGIRITDSRILGQYPMLSYFFSPCFFETVSRWVDLVGLELSV